jgi:nucleotide-binding universal stress UspA family protein
MRVLIVTNGSSDYESVLRFGGQIVGRSAEPPILLTIFQRESASASASVEQTRGLAQRFMEEDVTEVRSKIRVGPPAEEILGEAREGNYDLVIIGASEQKPAGPLLKNSTMVRVAEHAPCPVAIVKGTTGKIRRILLCDSGANGPTTAPPSEAARPPSVSERFVARLGALLGRELEITVLHVMSQISAGPGVRGKQLRADARELIDEHTPEGELLERDVRLLARCGFQSRAEIRHGLVVEEIVAEAQSGNYDLVVIGAPAGEGWRRFLLDDLARRILVQIDRPVLVVR